MQAHRVRRSAFGTTRAPNNFRGGQLVRLESGVARNVFGDLLNREREFANFDDQHQKAATVDSGGFVNFSKLIVHLFISVKIKSGGRRLQSVGPPKRISAQRIKNASSC